MTTPCKVEIPAGGDLWLLRSEDTSVAELTPGEQTLPAGALVIQHATGRHVPQWEGYRLHRVTSDGLRALHSGFYSESERDEWDRMMEKAVENAPLSAMPSPRSPNGRRRDFTSASQVERWLSCPASVRLSYEAAPPDEDSSEYARLGTAAHQMAEMGLTTGLDAADLTGVVTDTGLETDDAMVEHVQCYLDTVREDAGGDPDAEVETEIDIQVLAANQVFRGTLDAMLWTPSSGLLRVYDLKYGQGVLVGVEKNPQLRTYAIGALRRLGDRASEVRAIEMVIVQPRRPHFVGGRAEDVFDDETETLNEDPRVRRERLSYDELSQWFAEVYEPRAQLLDSPDAPFGPSADACRWCRVRHKCPALEDAALSAAQEAFAPLAPVSDLEAVAAAVEERKPKDVKQALAKTAETLSAKRVAEILNVSSLVSMWISAVESHAHGLLERGEHVPGFKLVRKFGNRTWIKSDTETLRELHGITGASVADFIKTSILSPAQVEKVLPKEHRGVVETLVHRPDRGLTMVPETDKRLAIDCSPSAVFGD